MTQPKTLEAALAEICKQHDLTSCSVDINFKQREGSRFCVTLHWDGYSDRGITCSSGNGTNIQDALALAIHRADSDRKICTPADALPAFEQVAS